MAAPLIHQNQVLAAKIESVYGTAEALVNTDAGFRVIDRHMRHPGETEQRERQGGLGVEKSIGGVTVYTEAEFTTHVAGKGASGVPFWATNFLKSCGFALSAQTFTASSDTSAWKSLTMGAYIDGRAFLGAGMMGTGTLTLEAGKPARIAWKYMGAYGGDPTDTAILTGMTYESALPPIWSGTGSLSLAAAATYTKVQKVEIDFGCEVALREDPNAPYGGYLGAWIGNRITKVKLDSEATLFAVKNYWAAWRAGTTTALSAVVGTATNNILTIAATLQPLAPDYGERNKKMIDNVEFLVDGDNLSLAFS